MVRRVMSQKSMPPGLSRAYLLALAPSAFLAPLPLLWTHGASRSAILLYELILLYLWSGRASEQTRSRLGRDGSTCSGSSTSAGSDSRSATLRLGLLRSVSHLLLFTALAKLASLKRPSEARMALLVIFLLTLASASSSTHVSSLVYFAVMAWLGFRTLARLAVLADFDEAPPDRVLTSVADGGHVGGRDRRRPRRAPSRCSSRCRGSTARSPSRRCALDDAFSQAQTSDRVDLDSFGAAKRSDRVILRLAARPRAAGGGLAPAARGGLHALPRRGLAPRAGRRTPPRRAAPRSPGEAQSSAVMTVDLNVIGRGFLFLPYGTSAVRVERGRAIERSDGVMQISGRGPVRYEARRAPPARARGGPRRDLGRRRPAGGPGVRRLPDRRPVRSEGDLPAHRGASPEGLRLHARSAPGEGRSDRRTSCCARRPGTASTSRPRPR